MDEQKLELKIQKVKLLEKVVDLKMQEMEMQQMEFTLRKRESNSLQQLRKAKIEYYQSITRTSIAKMDHAK